MKKTNVVLQLTGKMSNGMVAKTHQAAKVIGFTNNRVSVTKGLKDSVILTTITQKGVYTLKPHPSIDNLWTGVANNVKVHFTKKKIVAKLIYWA